MGPAHPSEQFLSDIFYRKCSLLMHMLLQTIGERDLNNIIREIHAEAIQFDDGKLEGDKLYRKLRKVVNKYTAKDFFDNWVWATSCPELTLNYQFNKRNNQIEVTMKQTSAAQSYFRFKDCLGKQVKTIFGKTGNEMKRQLYQSHIGENLTQVMAAQSLNISANSIVILDCLDAMDATFGGVDEKRAAKRWFNGNLSIMIYQIEGGSGDILHQHYKLQLKNFKTKVDAHISL